MQEQITCDQEPLPSSGYKMGILRRNLEEMAEKESQDKFSRFSEKSKSCAAKRDPERGFVEAAAFPSSSSSGTVLGGCLNSEK